MSDFVAFSEDIASGMEYMEHFGILGQKHGQRNGPPYPLGSGDHSAAEKQAAASAGVKVGSDSGKGSIDNVKKKKKAPVKKELTEEEKREAALKAVRDGDKKKIAKYMDYLSTDELRDAQSRSQMRDSLTRKDPDEMTKAEKDKRDAMLSGDKELVRQYADKMTTQELSDAMNKVRLTQELNFEPPPPSAMDKLTKVMNNVDTIRVNTEKAINAYNVAAKIYNSVPGHEGKWPIIGGNGGNNQEKKEKSDQEKAIEALAKQMSRDATREVKKTLEEKAAEELKEQKLAYKNQKKMEAYAEKLDKKYNKNKKKDSDSDDQNPPKNQQTENPKDTDNEPPRTSNQAQQTSQPESQNRAPQIRTATFHTNRQQEQPQTSTEPTAEQKRLIEEARKSDEQYLNRMNEVSKQAIKTSYNNVKDTPIASYDKVYQKDINDAFDDIMSDYNESVRRQQVMAQERRDRAQTVEDAKKYYRDAMYEGNREASRYWYEVIRNNE